MKYSESYSGRGKKLGTGFYILIACCLLIIGGAAWFALSNYADNQVTPKTESNQNNSYNEDNNSYNNNTPDVPSVPEVSENVAQSVEKEPYSSEETTDDSTVSYSFTMPVEGEILKYFSLSELQFSATYGDMRIHSGVDIACKNGTAVSACGNGVVKSVENDASMGTTVTLELSNGITVKYSTLDDLKVKNGDNVKVGDIIGNVASVPAECNDKEHLHIEAFKNGKSVSFLDELGLK